MRPPQEDFFTTILREFPFLEVRTVQPTTEPCLFLSYENIAHYHTLCRVLRDSYNYRYLSCLTALDYLRERVFHVVIHLENWEHNTLLWLKVSLQRSDPVLSSVSDIWSVANYLEREVYDMFGIVFTGHPNLSRILSPDDEVTYPLRKDFTLKDNDFYGECELKKVVFSATE